ncbi:MAG: DUF2791 family P-loop domain-containing protein [Spirochaetales bacterium]|nr:DUF2791 family P-loop domain-containing protein [Spirochaetales bacterium]
MTDEARINATLTQLARGEVPQSEQILGQISVGIEFLTDFWKEQYLEQFIAKGGSKIKFITGRAGSGKSHALSLFTSLAKHEGYLALRLSAKDVWLHDMRDLYLSILKEADIKALLHEAADRIIEQMGHDPKMIEENHTFFDHLAERGLADALTRQELRNQLRKMFLSNPRMDNNFAIACSLLTGSMLGHPILEEENQNLLYNWLGGDRSVRVTMLRPLGLAPSKVTKYNARNLLGSLVELVHVSGYTGLVVAIDDVEVMADASGMNPMRYTKMRREDAYESIRQLIDDIDTFNHFMVVFGFDRIMLDDEAKGFKSYQALWMRIQNEIKSERINKFADIADLDAIASEVYSPKMVVEMSRRLAEEVRRINIETRVVDEEGARVLIERAKSGAVSLPRLVNQATLGSLKEEDGYGMGV